MGVFELKIQTNSNNNHEKLTTLSCSLVCDCWFITAVRAAALAHLKLLGNFSMFLLLSHLNCACFSQGAEVKQTADSFL